MRVVFVRAVYWSELLAVLPLRRNPSQRRFGFGSTTGTTGRSGIVNAGDVAGLAIVSV